MFSLFLSLSLSLWVFVATHPYTTHHAPTHPATHPTKHTPCHTLRHPETFGDIWRRLEPIPKPIPESIPELILTASSGAHTTIGWKLKGASIGRPHTRACPGTTTRWCTCEAGQNLWGGPCQNSDAELGSSEERRGKYQCPAPTRKSMPRNDRWAKPWWTRPKPLGMALSKFRRRTWNRIMGE